MDRNKATTVSVFFAATCEINHIMAQLTSILAPDYNNTDNADHNHLIRLDCCAVGVLRPCFSYFRLA